MQRIPKGTAETRPALLRFSYLQLERWLESSTPMVQNRQHRGWPWQPVVWPAGDASQGAAAWSSPARENSTADGSDPLHPMGDLCPSCGVGVIGCPGKTGSNAGQVRKGLGAREHPQWEEQARSGCHVRLDRRELEPIFFSTFCKNTCYWIWTFFYLRRTSFLLYFGKRKNWWSALERGWEGSCFSQILFVIQRAAWLKYAQVLFLPPQIFSVNILWKTWFWSVLLFR